MMSFIGEEKGQGAIEYILLAGGIIVAAVIIFVVYQSMIGSATENATKQVDTLMEKQQQMMDDALANMSGG